MKIIKKILIFLIQEIRPYLGAVGGVCIYPISCSLYAHDHLKQTPLWKAIPKITLRVLSCNPLTALFFRFHKFIFNKKP